MKMRNQKIRYREISEEETNIKRKYGRKRCHSMSGERNKN